MTEDAHPAYLSPSELGSKDYWETYYARTLSHISQAHQSTHNTNSHPAANNDNDKYKDKDEVDDDSDPGTSWFSEHNAPEKILQFLTRKSFPLSPYHYQKKKKKKKKKKKEESDSAQPSILDLGTGNGSMLALLRKKGRFGGYMVGVDYSGQSVELARELQDSRGHSAYWTDEESDEDEVVDEDAFEGGGEGEDEGESEAKRPETEAIRFEEWDILSSNAALSPSGAAMSPPPPSSDQERLPWFPYEKGGFDIVLDKGTFDAVSLSENAKMTRVCERYPDIVRRLVRRGGFVVVTSCNWTEEELIRWFTRNDSKDRLVVWGLVEYPRFRFGGAEGQGVCTVCFERVGDA